MSKRGMSRQTKANCFCHAVFVLAGMDDCKAEIFKLISQTEPLFSGAYAVRKQKISCPAKSSCKRTLYETESHRSWVGPKKQELQVPCPNSPQSSGCNGKGATAGDPSNVEKKAGLKLHRRQQFQRISSLQGLAGSACIRPAYPT